MWALASLATVLLGRGRQATQGTSEEKVGVLRSATGPFYRRPLPLRSGLSVFYMSGADKEGLTAESWTECLM